MRVDPNTHMIVSIEAERRFGYDEEQTCCQLGVSKLHCQLLNFHFVQMVSKCQNAEKRERSDG